MLPPKLSFFGAVVLTASFLLASHGQAAIIAQQEFTTPSTSTGFNNNFETAGTSVTGLTYPGLLTLGAARALTTGPQSSFTAGSQTNVGTYYISFLLDTGTANNLAGRVGLTLFASNFSDGNGNGTGTEVAEIGQNAGVVRIQGGSFESTTNQFPNMASTTATTAGTNLYVIGVNANGASTSISLYYDPTPGVQPAMPLLTYNTGITFHLEQVRLFGNGTYDEIRVGNTFADVTPTSAPEPSTLAIAGIGLALAGRWLARRSR